MYRKTVLLAALLVVLSLLFLFQETRELRGNTVELALPPEGVDTITISRGEESLTLRREGDGWQVGAERYRGDRKVIEELLSSLRELEEVDVVSGRSNYERYGLTEAEAYELSLEQEGTEVLKLRLGANATAGGTVYGRVNDRPEVVLLPRRLKERAGVDPGEFRNKLMASIEVESIREATIAGSGVEAFTLRAGGTQNTPADATALEEIDATWQSEGPERVSPERIQQFLQELSSLRAQEFLDSRPNGTPFGTVTLDTTNGQERFELYPPEENDLYPVVASMTEDVFLIPEWRARRLLLGIDGFFEPFQDGG
ncbi:MAG: DUF4340 domain-containing protein [Alkalispirochaetaceae bacterium]